MSKHSRKQLGQKIRMLRKEQSLTQQKLADMIGRSSQHTSEIELGNANPTFETLEKIAKALGVPLSELLNDID